jgi:hypothetical protein
MDIWDLIEAHYPLVVSIALVVIVLGAAYVFRGFRQRRQWLADLAQGICDPGSWDIFYGFGSQSNPEWTLVGKIRGHRISFAPRMCWKKNDACVFVLELAQLPEEHLRSSLRTEIASLVPARWQFCSGSKWIADFYCVFERGVCGIVDLHDKNVSSELIRQYFDSVLRLLESKPFFRDPITTTDAPLVLHTGRKMQRIWLLVGFIGSLLFFKLCR